MRADDVNVFEEPSALESFQSKLAAVPLRQPDVGSIEPTEQTSAQKRVQGLASLLQRVGYGGGDPRRSFQMSQKLLRTFDPYQQGGIGEFLPGFSYQLAQERGDKFGQLLSTIDLLPGAAIGTAALKAGKAGKGIETLAKSQAMTEPKDMVFLHNTSPDKLALYDNIGGLPSPSIAVTKADTPHEGYGKITLVGKPEKFDPAVDQRNKVYSADAYTPRGPRPLRLAKPGAAKQIEKDYKEINRRYGDRYEFSQSGLDSASFALENLDPKNLFYPENRLDELNRFFDGPLAVRKYMSEKRISEKALDNYGLFKDFKQRQRFQDWAKQEKDKYLSQDAVFQYFDEAEETMKTVPYNTENVVANMIADTQRGGEGIPGSASDAYLRALSSKEFPSLQDIKADKSRITSEFTYGDNYLDDDIENLLEPLGLDLQVDTLQTFIKNFVKTKLERGEKLKTSVDEAVNSLVKNSNLKNKDAKKLKDEMFEVFEDNANRAVSYFEAKPTRAVDFDEFAGAIVPANTKKTTIDLLKKRGLKVIKEKEGTTKSDLIKKNFGKELFSVAPIAAAASATAIIEGENKGIDAL